MNRFSLAVLVLPTILGAQSRVQLEPGASTHVFAKAREQNKYALFIGCSQAPSCDVLDTTVFTHDSVASFINKKFVVARIGDDSAFALKYGANNRRLTLLFFSPEGSIVHRGANASTDSAFMTLAREALDTSTQYYVQLAAFERGEKNYAVMPAVALTAHASNDRETARRVANAYVQHLKPEERFTKDNIAFIARFTEKSSDPAFGMFLQPGSGDRINEIMAKPGFAEGVVDRIIRAEEITPAASSATEPDWKMLSATIAKKYTAVYADRTITDVQIRWFAANQRTPEMVRAIAKKLEVYGAQLAPGAVNMLAWELFLNTDDKALLEKGIIRMERVARDVEKDPTPAGAMGPAFVDTYANLLYRAGRKTDAITWQEKAVKLMASDSPWKKAIPANLEKMKKGEATWE